MRKMYNIANIHVTKQWQSIEQFSKRKVEEKGIPAVKANGVGTGSAPPGASGHCNPLLRGRDAGSKSNTVQSLC